MTDFRLWTDAFADNSSMPKAQEYGNPAFGAFGDNESPALFWEGVPEGTKSLAVTCYDPDAPTGSGFWHWIAYNIPADITELAANAGLAGGANLPAGAVQASNDFGNEAFDGAAPPVGDKPHRYIFRVHALSVEKIELWPGATNAFARFTLFQNEIASASYTGLYSR